MLSKLNVYITITIGLWLSAQLPVYAGVIDDILVIHKIQKPEKIAYTQTKHNPFLSEPVLAIGTIYLQSDYFVMQQDTPQPMVVVSDHEHLWFYNVDQDRRFERKISRLQQKDPALDALISTLRFGDIAVLQKQFDMKASVLDAAWTLEMKPLHYRSKKLYEQIILQGQINQKVERFEMLSKQGNRTVWQFKTQAFSSEDKALIEFLKQTARGS